MSVFVFIMEQCIVHLWNLKLWWFIQAYFPLHTEMSFVECVLFPQVVPLWNGDVTLCGSWYNYHVFSCSLHMSNFSLSFCIVCLSPLQSQPSQATPKPAAQVSTVKPAQFEVSNIPFVMLFNLFSRSTSFSKETHSLTSCVWRTPDTPPLLSELCSYFLSRTSTVLCLKVAAFLIRVRG